MRLSAISRLCSELLSLKLSKVVRIANIITISMLKLGEMTLIMLFLATNGASHIPSSTSRHVRLTGAIHDVDVPSKSHMGS